ncbi:MAG: NIPSNAP family protein [Candidatus Rokubacteria bacterium]|nr:NIPSNAP family protein [Candidatus Rokubacteria bacterium]
MIYELRTYTLTPGKLPEYLKLNVEVGRKIRGDDYGRLAGSWTTEFGTLNRYVHLWEYPSLDERERLRGQLAKNDAWTKEYVPRIRTLILAQENKILSPQLPLEPPADSGWLYELRWYRSHTGRIGEWIGHIKDIMPVREKYSKNVGLWQTEAGQLNEAVHMWAYRDLNERASVRARAIADPEWQAFLGKATPLLVDMKSIILIPAPSSPMK